MLFVKFLPWRAQKEAKWYNCTPEGYFCTPGTRRHGKKPAFLTAVNGKYIKYLAHNKK
jgi:hypothetical protein